MSGPVFDRDNLDNSRIIDHLDRASERQLQPVKLEFTERTSFISEISAGMWRG